MERNNITDIYKTFIKFIKDIKTLDSTNPHYKIVDDLVYVKLVNSFNILLYIYYSSVIMANNDKTMIETYNQNSLIFYYTCSYIILDYILDDPTIPKANKKQVVMYINTLFLSGKHDTSKYDLIQNYIPSISKAFDILFTYDKKEYPEVYRSLYDIFKFESLSSSYQSFNDSSDKKDINKILEHTLNKGRETVFSIFQVCNPKKVYKDDRAYYFIASHFGFVLQLLDDFMDVDQDVKEKSVTIFSYPILYDLENKDEYLEKNIGKLLNYISSIEFIISEKTIKEKFNLDELYSKDLFIVGNKLLINKGLITNNSYSNIVLKYQQSLLFKTNIFEELDKLTNKLLSVLLIKA